MTDTETPDDMRALSGSRNLGFGFYSINYWISKQLIALQVKETQ